jgi:hypothetical protein
VSEEERSWLAKYGALSVGELKKADGDFALHLTEVCNPVWDEYRSRGEFEVLGTRGDRIKFSNWDEKPLTQVRVPSEAEPDQRVLKVTIRESEYPDLYVLQREHLWLRQRLSDQTKLALK